MNNLCFDDEKKFCCRCTWNDCDYGCTCPPNEEVYQCPMYMHYHPEEVDKFNKAMEEYQNRRRKERINAMNNEKNAYDIIADAVREYVHNTNDVIDYAYIVSFRMSYHPYKDFKKYTEIVYYNDDGSIDFEMDFCEGEKYVVDIDILPLYKVGEFMTTCKYYADI